MAVRKEKGKSMWMVQASYVDYEGITEELKAEEPRLDQVDECYS